MPEKEVLKILKSAGVDAMPEQLERPPQMDMGDLCLPCFPLAKVFRKNPMEIASDIAKKAKIPKGSLVSKIEAKGGYVNFFFDYPKFAAMVLKDLDKKIDIGKGERVMVEYSQPNPVHPMHVGHARNTFLGDSISNILDFVGYDVVRANYMNNVGLQVAKLVLAYKMWSGGRVPNVKPDAWLWDYYIRFHKEAETNPDMEKQAQSLLKKYELEGDRQVAVLWDKIVKWCIDGFEETYKKVGVKFDVYFYESNFREAGHGLVKESVEKGISRETEDGAVFADLEKFGLPGTIIQRSDGTGLYITSDLGLTVHKFSKYKLSGSFWVSHAQQDLHFQQLFKLFEVMGYPFHKNCVHVSYEWVSLPDGKMSSRQGRAVMMDDVIDKVSGIAYKEVSDRNPKMPIGKKKNIAGKIAIGAFKYAMVRIEPNKQIVFDWDHSLSLEGNTGPYLQYAHTRCNSILRKAKKFSSTKSFKDLDEHDMSLVRKLSEFRQAVVQSAKEAKPHIVCNYGYDLATVFNSFYQSSPVLGLKNRKQRDFRLTLVKSTKETLEKVFGLVGMEAPEKM